MEAIEQTEAHRERARAYLMLLVPSMKRAVGTAGGKGVEWLVEKLDWAVIMEPLVSTFATALNDEEIGRAIAWIESPLYAKMAELGEEVTVRVQAGFMQAMGKLLAEET